MNVPSALVGGRGLVVGTGVPSAEARVLVAVEDAGEQQGRADHDEDGDRGHQDADVPAALAGLLGAALQLALQVALRGLAPLLARGHGSNSSWDSRWHGGAAPEDSGRAAARGSGRV